MKNRKNPTALVLVLLFCATMSAAAQIAFTYQGRLTDNESSANGNYDLQFILRDAATNQVGSVVTASSVGVTNGLFTAPLDFGANAFDGTARWLEIAVRKNEPPGPPPAFVTLSPRQPITVAPYALQAVRAATASGLSSIGNQPLEFFVNNSRALRLEPTTNSPNVIAGFSGNYVSPGAVGATISGGGTVSNFFGTIATNRVTANYGTVSGGQGNAVNGLEGTIAGGRGNIVETNAEQSVIGGGAYNTIRTNAGVSVIAGGVDNIIGPRAGASTVAGGASNSIGPDASWAFLGSGFLNRVGSSYSSIAGGEENTIGNGGRAVTVGGGRRNIIAGATEGAVIAGGDSNRIGTNSNYSAIGGGVANVILETNVAATVSGGSGNKVETDAYLATIAGGEANEVWSGASTISGGRQNLVGAGSRISSIGGGELNRIHDNDVGSTIAGGSENGVWPGSPFATIAGGQGNNIYGILGTIAGGSGNLIFANAGGATIGGGQDNQVGTNATWATIPGGTLAKATSYGQLAYASGGFAGRNVAGMAQSSLFVLRRYTTNSVPTELLLDGGELGGRRMMLSNNGTWLFDIIVVARNSTGDCAGFQIKNMIKNVAGTTSLVNLANVTRLPSDPTTSTWNVTVEADDANDALVVKVTGADSTTIRWVASVRTVEVIF
jgi:hypothetical protein